MYIYINIYVCIRTYVYVWRESKCRARPIPTRVIQIGPYVQITKYFPDCKDRKAITYPTVISKKSESVSN